MKSELLLAKHKQAYLKKSKPTTTNLWFQGLQMCFIIIFHWMHTERKNSNSKFIIMKSE